MGLEGWPASPLSRLGSGSAFRDAYAVGLSVRLAVTLCQPMSACVFPWCLRSRQSMSAVPTVPQELLSLRAWIGPEQNLLASLASGLQSLVVRQLLPFAIRHGCDLHDWWARGLEYGRYRRRFPC